MPAWLVTDHAACRSVLNDPVFAKLGSPIAMTLAAQGRPERRTRDHRESVGEGGTRIAAGDILVPALYAANRDPQRFPEPDALDLTRSASSHLAFGPAPTTASAPPWRGWRAGSRCARCSPGSHTSNWPSPPRTCSGAPACCSTASLNCPSGSAVLQRGKRREHAGHPATDAPSVDRPSRYDPLRRLAGHLADDLEVGVVVQEGDPMPLRHRRDHQVGDPDRAVSSGPS